jgi:hypothetical protein
MHVCLPDAEHVLRTQSVRRTQRPRCVRRSRSSRSRRPLHLRSWATTATGAVIAVVAPPTTVPVASSATGGVSPVDEAARRF